MLNKIRVVHHSKSVGYSGTDRTCQLFAKHLAQSDKYEPFIVYRKGDSANTRLDIVKKWLGEDHVIPYEWVPGKSGRLSPYNPEHDNYFDTIVGIDPQIVHYHASGYNEFPIFKWLSPKAKIVTTNIFGYADETRQADLVIYISEYNKGLALEKGGPDGPVLYNPIEQPYLDMTPENKEMCRENLLLKYKIPHNAVLLGRVGRPDNFDPISLKAFKEIESEFPEAWYLVVNPCQAWRDMADRLGISNIRFIDPIIDDFELSKFYMGIDIYAHARHDGEICPTNIQEAMMHGLPIVSHESGIYNGQSEIIGNAGFVVPLGDHVNYAKILASLIENKEVDTDNGKARLRTYFGREARRRAMRYFEASTTTSILEKIYGTI
jgi:glycosyltransferase involved in cell wall biosynthesis